MHPRLSREAGAALVTLLVSGPSCSTVEPGTEFAIAAVSYDENYFYCVVEPKVIIAKSCGSGDPSQGDQSGCHASVTQFKINSSMMPVPCNGLSPAGAIPLSSQQNYEAAQGEMSLDVKNIPLLAWPTQQYSGHPRKIFAADSPEADIVRKWATQYASH